MYFYCRSSLAEVSIQVIDENDNNPFFIVDIHNLTVMENAKIGTEIAVIMARDADSDDYGKITYLLDRMSAQVNISHYYPFDFFSLYIFFHIV